MKTLYDVQQLLKQFGIVVYLGKRLYDIEMMKIELEALYQNGLVDKDSYLKIGRASCRERVYVLV